MSDDVVRVRMYNVGFGDAFVVTVGDPVRWRILIDCGVHSHGLARPIGETVGHIINDTADGRNPQFDAIIATHHHADHLAGFADPRWDQVTVGEVWLPWVEDPDDAQAGELRKRRVAVADAINALSSQPMTKTSLAADALRVAGVLAANASGNDAAIQRLLGRTDGFVNPGNVRFLPEGDDVITELQTTVDGVTVHVVGPPRDEKRLRRMNPPKSAEWLTGLVDRHDMNINDAPGLLFADAFVIDERHLQEPRFTPLCSQPAKRKAFRQLTNFQVLDAASRLESWCNNTSLFLIITAGTRRLVFPGDAQQGAWEYVLDNPAAAALIADADFYKISHHGSHNGTPRHAVDTVFGNGKTTMLPFRTVNNWTKIPKQSLLDELEAHGHTIVRSDQMVASDTVRVETDLYCEYTIRP